MNDDYELLMIPGPTNLPDEVRQALSAPQISHRVGRFKQLITECTEGLQQLFGTRQPVITLTSSGTGAMEAALVNMLSPGDPVVAVDTGKFGDRLALIAEAFGAQVHRLRVERGQVARPEQLQEACEAARPRAVLMIQNETSTGVCQDVAALAEVARRCDALTMVDCVSSLGGYPMLMDEWGLDAVVAGSQKALMLPPGLAFIAYSERAWEATEQAQMPKFYFDLRAARKSLTKQQTPYTPNTSLFVALKAALDLIFNEGLEEGFTRHRRLAAATRAAVQAMGLGLFADPQHLSTTVTAITSPPGVDSSDLTKLVRENCQIIISGGQDELKGKIFRIGHLGLAQLDELLRTLSATAAGLNELGFACDGSAALAAAQAAYEETT